MQALNTLKTYYLSQICLGNIKAEKKEFWLYKQFEITRDATIQNQMLEIVNDAIRSFPKTENFDEFCDSLCELFSLLGKVAHSLHLITRFHHN